MADHKFDRFHHRVERAACGFLALVLLLTGVGLPLRHTSFALEAEPICGQQAHTHTEECCTQECICTQQETATEQCTIEEHTHSDECHTLSDVLSCEDAAHTHEDICYVQQQSLTCTATEHTHGTDCTVPTDTLPHLHTDACYASVLNCILSEHIHTDACFSDPSADIEQPADWEATLPSLAESASIKESVASIAQSQLGYRESTKNVRIDAAGVRQGYTRYGAWYGDPYGPWNGMFAAFCLSYAGAASAVIPQSANPEEMLSGSTVLSVIETSPQRGMLFFFKDAAEQISVGIVTDVSASQLTGIMGDADGAAAQITLSLDDAAILGCADPDALPQTEETPAELPPLTDPMLEILEQQPLMLQSRAVIKAEKDNSSVLEQIRCEDTREYITLNLYNYGNNINEKYQSDSKYPGFQQEYGTSSGTKTSDSNFGTNITADLAAGINGLTNGASGINKVTDKANSPITKVETVMYPTLKDGYPALADGTSLGYLFGADSSYSKKQNSKSISGLFRYNETTGAYTYNSRENHAQFDPDTDTFRVYRQMLTSNMTLYPFGNFLPFNDIVRDAKRVSEIDRAYIESIASAAQARQDAGESVYNNEYQTLATALTNWIAAMDAVYPSGWSAANAINEYFNTVVGSGFDFSAQTELLEKLFCLDYDVPTDFYFGLEMEMSFLQPRGGLTGADGKQPMRFYFTGDDDVWVYVDDVLFLDLSGIHRHVGGEIDFESGTVRYYSLDPSSGDVSSTPWKEVRFSEILGSTDGLNAAGTFPNYSVHDLHFYYMERGSGSGVCRLNFNMPLLRENSISVTKELSVDDGSASVLGDPDFLFQVLKENGDLFLSEGKAYTVLDAAGNTVDTRTVDENGILHLKAGQTAVIGGIAENAGTYFVRELLDADTFSQYGTVSVDGSTVTSDHYTNAVIGTDTFRGVDSNVKDASDGATVFRFENHVSLHKLGTLEIEKVLESYSPQRSAPMFRFRVLLDTVPIAVGSTYTVTASDGTEQSRTVEEEGVLNLAAGETAKIKHILAGTRFIVEELDAKQAGYTVRYVVDGGAVADGYAAGTIGIDTTVRAVVTNTERGAAVRIPVRKILTVDDNENTAFSVLLEQLADAETDTPMPNGTVQTIHVSPDTMGEFFLAYAEPSLPALPAKYYYRISEQIPTAQDDYRFDPSVYRVEVTVDRDADDVLTASVTGAWKDGAIYGTQTPIRFQNTRLTSLTVEKTVQGASVGTEAVFRAELQLLVNGSPWQQDCRIETAEEEKRLTFDENGKVLLDLRAGEPVTLSELPFGAQWTLTELDTDGFKVSMRVNDEPATVGSTATGSLPADGTNVEIINASDYALPSTGSIGVIPLYALGMCLATVSLLVRRRRIQR